MSGAWVADNTTFDEGDVPAMGTWTFTRAVSSIDRNMVAGCLRPIGMPWYLQIFPSWTAYIIVPTFSFLSSINNLQPIQTLEMFVMCFISCCAYATNKVANHYIFDRSDVVSAIGAFTVGFLGNAYARKAKSTAFTCMVTGVLFLVPVLSPLLPLFFDLTPP
jgi:hypothetical protein